MPVHTQQVAESNLQFNQDSLRAIIREELAVALAPANNSSTTPQVQTSRHQPSAQLSPPSPFSRVGLSQSQPAAVIPISSTQPAGQSSVMPTTGTGNQLLTSLPLLSAKLRNAIEQREYVDFAQLLPTTLYAASRPSQIVNFSIQPSSESGEGGLSVRSAPKQAVRINNFQQWLEAWNVFARVTVSFHPHLASQLFAYQDAICTFNGHYRFTAWYAYDVAFRIGMAADKSLSFHFSFHFNLFIHGNPLRIILLYREPC